MRPHLQKSNPVKSKAALGEYRSGHDFCAACGRRDSGLTVAHIIGGRGSRSHEPPNLLVLCWIPCHSFLMDGGDVAWKEETRPRITFAVAIALKRRLGELNQAAIERLTLLHGRNLPDEEPVPEWFAKQWEANVHPDEFQQWLKEKR